MRFRYPGAKPFAINEMNLFFGRENEVNHFFNLIQTEPLVVLYGKSGLGKSSLIQAGILPQLNSLPHCFSQYIRFGSYSETNNTSPIQSVKNKIIESDSGTYKNLLSNDQSLWFLLKEKQMNQLSVQAKAPEFYFIFDQFEELFTYPDEEILEFNQQLAEVLYQTVPERFVNEITIKHDLFPDKFLLQIFEKINIHVIFITRSDKLSLLNKLSSSLPAILKKCYELEPLSTKQAKSAIVKPALYGKTCDTHFLYDDFYTPPFTYDEKAINKIIEYLSGAGEKQIEPFQLQVICQYCEKKILEKTTSVAIADKFFISENDLTQIEEVYQNYYDSTLATLNEKEQLLARNFIENALIFEEDERRLSLYEGQIIKQHGINRDLLNKLVNLRILRSEPHISGGFSYEICHDTLVSPILKSKKNRFVQLEIENQKRIAFEQIKAIENTQKARTRKFVSRISMAALFIILVSLFSYGMVVRNKNRELSRINKEMKDAFENLSKFSNIKTDKNGDTIQLSFQLSIVNEQITSIGSQFKELQKISSHLDTAVSFPKSTQAKDVTYFVKRLMGIVGNLKANDILVKYTGTDTLSNLASNSKTDNKTIPEKNTELLTVSQPNITTDAENFNVSPFSITDLAKESQNRILNTPKYKKSSVSGLLIKNIEITANSTIVSICMNSIEASYNIYATSYLISPSSLRKYKLIDTKNIPIAPEGKFVKKGEEYCFQLIFEKIDTAFKTISLIEETERDTKSNPFRITDIAMENGQPVGLNSRYGSFVDVRDGNKYTTIREGNQIWMAENLLFKIKDDENNNLKSFNNRKFGRLYTYQAALFACPAGWHLASYSEWESLIKLQGGEKSTYQKLAVTGNGFDVLFSGYFSNFSNTLREEQTNAYFWTSTSQSASRATAILFSSDEKKVITLVNANSKDAYSIRCVKDDASK